MRPSLLRGIHRLSTATTIHSSDRNSHQWKSKVIIPQSQSVLVVVRTWLLHWKGINRVMDLIYDKNYEWYDELEGFSKKIQHIFEYFIVGWVIGLV